MSQVNRDGNKTGGLHWPLSMTFMIVALIAASPVAVGQDFLTDTIGQWDVAANWSGNATPDSFARIAGSGRNNSIVTLDSVETLVGAGSGGRFIFGQGGTGGSLTIVSGGSLTTSGTVVHRIGQTSGFDLTIETGGTLNVQNAPVTSEVGSNFTVSGGDVDFGGNYTLGSDSTIAIESSTATFNIGDDLSIGSTSTLNYTFDATGIASIDIGDVLTINSGADLVIDASQYIPGATTISLATFGSLANANEFDETIIVPAGFTADVVYGANSLDLVLSASAVPEPSSLILLATGAVICLFRRRQRHLSLAK